jgi:transcriptional antiterminator NusG
LTQFTPSEPLWYALTTAPSHEQFSSDILASKGYDPFPAIYVEERRWSDRKKLVERPLFPRYIFCRFPFELRREVLITPGITGLVKFGLTVLPVADAEIEAIRTVLASGLPLMRVDYVAVGDRVLIERGAFQGVYGVVKREKGQDRLIVSVDAICSSVAVELDRAWVKKAA